MSEMSLMQRVLGAQWEQLPSVLQKHYQHDKNKDIGTLDIEYPSAMQLYLNFMRLFGVLINKRGENIPTTVSKSMNEGTQYWERTIQFPDSKPVLFKSHWVYVGNNELIEYVNSFLGLRMAAYVKDQVLYYEGKYFVLKFGRILLPIPEWLVLGHTTIEERALNDGRFAMDFRLKHIVFGEVFRYAGKFSTKP